MILILVLRYQNSTPFYHQHLTCLLPALFQYLRANIDKNSSSIAKKCHAKMIKKTLRMQRHQVLFRHERLSISNTFLEIFQTFEDASKASGLMET